MKYLKLYEEFNTDIKYSISWQGPTDELINQEMHELLNNCEFFLIEENFDKVFSKMPSFYFYIVKKYLKKETTDKLINEEMHELLNNCEFFFIKENFDKVFSKMPKILRVKNYSQKTIDNYL